MPSAVIRSYDYSPESQELTVEFVTGRRYVYEAVPVGEAVRMGAAFSKGSYFNRRIRGHYAFRRLA